MKFLFSSGSLYTYGIERCFGFAAGAGFDGIELMVDERWDTRQPAYLQQLCDRYHLPIHAVHSPFRTVPGWESGDVAAIKQTVALAESLDAGTVVHHLPRRVGLIFVTMQGRRHIVPSPGRNPSRAYHDWLAGGGYQNLQKTTDVTLCIENMPAWRALGRRWNGFHWNSPEALTRFPSLTLDTTHLGTWGLEPADVYARWRQRVRHVHVSNFDGQQHCLPLDGHLDLGRFLGALAADGYAGNTTMELRPPAVGAGSSDSQIEQALTANLRQCRAWAGQA